MPDRSGVADGPDVVRRGSPDGTQVRQRVAVDLSPGSHPAPETVRAEDAASVSDGPDIAWAACPDPANVGIGPARQVVERGLERGRAIDPSFGVQDLGDLPGRQEVRAVEHPDVLCARSIKSEELGRQYVDLREDLSRRPVWTIFFPAVAVPNVVDARDPHVVRTAPPDRDERLRLPCIREDAGRRPLRSVVVEDGAPRSDGPHVVRTTAPDGVGGDAAEVDIDDAPAIGAALVRRRHRAVFGRLRVTLDAGYGLGTPSVGVAARGQVAILGRSSAARGAAHTEREDDQERELRGKRVHPALPLH